MRRILPVLLLATVSLLWIGTLDPHDTLQRRLPETRVLGAEPPSRLTVPKFVPLDLSLPASAWAGIANQPAPQDANWLAGIERGLAEREYQASVNHRGLQTPNRAQNLRTYFEPSGIRVMDRTAPGEPELARIRLRAFGREGALAAAGDARVSHENARVELVRDGLVEWYENAPAGLEQGFTLATRPAGAGPLVLELDVDGAGVSLEGDEATLASASEGGRRLQYGKLAAFDANNVALAAHLEALGDGLRIVTDDRAAAYPVTIDPLISNTFDTQINTVETASQFGQHLASAGDVNGDGYGDVLVGAEAFDNGQTDEGGAFVYLGGPNGIPAGVTPDAIFQSDQAQARLGRGLSAGDFNGDGYSDVIIGAYNYTLDQSGEGAAFVFNGGPSGIMNGTPASASATLQSNDAFARFGISVASAGDINGDGYEDVVVGASDYDNANDGAAFIFHGSASGVVTTAATTLIATQTGSNFGWVVAGAGDINADGFADVAISMYRYTSGHHFEGGIFIYHGSATGIPNGSQATATGSVQSDIAEIQFGYSLAAAGDVNGDGYSDLAAGTLFYTNGSSNEGAAWVFHGGSGGIGNITIANAATRIEANQVSAFMAGTGMLAGAGDVNGDGYGDLIIGSDRYDLGQTDEGAAFVFIGGPTGITATSSSQAYATLQSDQVNARLGLGVAGVGDVNGDGYDDVMAGAILWGASDEGAAFLYRGGARGMTGVNWINARAYYRSDQTLQAGTLYPQFGKSVASAGDVNGDGIGDLIIGSPGYDLGEADEGAAFVFLGGAFVTGTPANAHATLQSNVTGTLFGQSVAGAGDVDDDGYADVIVGAPATAGGGAAYLFKGSATGVANGDPTTAATVLTSELDPASMGCSVAGAGDVNGDGFADVIVGAELFSGGAGGAFIFLGSATGVASATTATAATRLTSGQIQHGGHSVAGAGDVNGDGYADVIVGAPLRNAGTYQEGGASVFHGSASGIAHQYIGLGNAELESNENNAQLGTSVAGAGDTNGDGYGDVIVGAIFYGASDPGAAFVWRGSASGIVGTHPLNAAMTFLGSLNNGYQGASVACAGDLNGDGLADLLVGRPDPVNFLGQNAACLVYAGSKVMMPPPVSSPVLATLTSTQGGEYGCSVAGAGDMDGDGFADVIVGSLRMTWPVANEGLAFLYNGGSVELGRKNRVLQFTSTGANRVAQPWGKSYAADRFAVTAAMVDAEGRKRLKLEIENCPTGVAFGSASCTKTTSAEWIDSGANPNGLTRAELLTSVPGGLRRWRARTLVAPFRVTMAGITAPPNPRHGPWRRFQGQANEADLRVTVGTVAVEFRHDPSSFAIERLVNPSRGRIEFAVVLSGSEPAKAELFDVAGRRWLSRDLPSLGPTRSEFRWDEGRNLPAGSYLLRLTQGRRAATARLVILP